MLLTFGQMLKNLKFEWGDAANLKWIQALGTGMDGITDQPSLKPSVTITSLHGVHGAPVSEAALAGMFTLARDIPRFVRNQDTQTWGRWPAKLLSEKTCGILGIGVISEALAPKCKALGMKTIRLHVEAAPRAGLRVRVYGMSDFIQARAGDRSPCAINALHARDPSHDQRRSVLGNKTFELPDQRGARRHR